MRSIIRNSLLALAAVALLGAPFVLGDRLARANGSACVARMAGLETSRKTPVEVVAFNTTESEITLDLRLYDTAGETVLDRPGGVVIGPFQTAIVGLEAELSAGLGSKERPFEGVVAVELAGTAPFAEDAVLVHATQYFGKRKRPRGAVVFRPLFQTIE